MPVRVVDLGDAGIDAQALEAVQVIADEGPGAAADIEKSPGTAKMGGDGAKLQVVPAIPHPRLTLIDLVIEACWNVLLIVVARARHHLFSGLRRPSYTENDLSASPAPHKSPVLRCPGAD